MKKALCESPPESPSWQQMDTVMSQEVRLMGQELKMVLLSRQPRISAEQTIGEQVCQLHLGSHSQGTQPEVAGGSHNAQGGPCTGASVPHPPGPPPACAARLSHPLPLLARAANTCTARV